MVLALLEQILRSSQEEFLGYKAENARVCGRERQGRQGALRCGQQRYDPR